AVAAVIKAIAATEIKIFLTSFIGISFLRLVFKVYKFNIILNILRSMNLKLEFYEKTFRNHLKQKSPDQIESI
ncbi:MAG: hypothetical protein II563_04490, partial [Treponema sp.]|nr:hypothetical protein [Treponema sp.]